MIGNPSYIARGGAVLFSLQAGPACAGQARALLWSTMQALGLPNDLIEDGALAVSELATNAHLHADSSESSDPHAGAELWIWSTTVPYPHLVISVFDTNRDTMPHPSHTNPLDESGRGLAIVENLTSKWGAQRTRSRLNPEPRPGKRVWFAFALPHPWPWTLRIVSASLASKRLADLLLARGITTTRICDDKGIALITTGHLNIWVEPKAFTWHDGNGGRVSYPHLDLQEATEHVIALLEQTTTQPLPPAYPSTAADGSSGRTAHPST